MQLVVKELKESKESLKFDFYIDALEDIELAQKVHVTGEASNNNGKIIVSGKYKTIINTTCVRCLAKNEVEIENGFSATFLDEQEYINYVKSLNPECEINLEDEVYDEIKDGKIDLNELVREYIILDLSPYPQCQPFCKDETEIKKYQDDGIDPRWQQLLNIKN